MTNSLDGSTVSGEVIISAIAYDEGVGTTDGDTQNENVAPFGMTWNRADLTDNGVVNVARPLIPSRKVGAIAQNIGKHRILAMRRNVV